jgi:glycosyltransferase involved in cell wall biosynthesis
MNVTLICNEYPPLPQGGIGTFTYHYAHGLARAGHSVTVIGLTDRGCEFHDGDVRVVFLRGARKMDRRLLRAWLERDVQSRSTDIVEAPEFDGMLPFRLAGCEVVIRLHQSLSGIEIARRRPPGPGTYFFERETLRRHRQWIGVSRAVLTYAQRVFLLRPSAAEVIHNFAPPLLPPDQSAVDAIRREHGDFVIFVGKLTEPKGALDLARAAARFLGQFPALRLVYLGDDGVCRGRTMSSLIREAVGEPGSTRVLFLGRRPHSEAMSWVAAARAFVLPSHLEAFSMAPLEAMRLGVPVIYTSRASGPELVEDGRTGLLVDPAKPDRIAAAVARVISDRAFGAAMARAASEVLASRFSLEACVARSLKFYARALGQQLPVAGCPATEEDIKCRVF